jgi:hypothetical protein
MLFWGRIVLTPETDHGKGAIDASFHIYVTRGSLDVELPKFSWAL